MEKISSLPGFLSKVQDKEISYILLYKSGSALSECALENLKQASKKIKDVQIFEADVLTVRDIHPHYGIDSVPSFLEIEKGHLLNNYKGCNSVAFYQNVLERAAFNAQQVNDKHVHRVTVYSTPTCSWCNTLKAYFKQQQVVYTDIDVSRNTQAAQEMVRRSGQQGVPQTDIDGTMVVGFDRVKINSLLGLK